jgi:hypothetical protein
MDCNGRSRVARNPSSRIASPNGSLIIESSGLKELEAPPSILDAESCSHLNGSDGLTDPVDSCELLNKGSLIS